MSLCKLGAWWTFASLLTGMLSLSASDSRSQEAGRRPSSAASAAQITKSVAPAARPPNQQSAAAKVPELATREVLRFDYFDTSQSMPEKGVSLGQAWNTLDGTGISANCVTGEERKFEGSATLRTRYWDVQDREQLFSALNVSAEGSYGSFSGSASFARKVTIDKERRHVLAVADVNHYSMTLVPVNWNEGVKSDAGEPRLRLKPRYQSWLEKEGTAGLVKFLSECGNSFVVSIAYGGAIDAVAHFERDEKEVQETYSAGGKYLVASASVSGETRRKFEHQSTEVEMIQRGKGFKFVRSGDQLKKELDDPKLAALQPENATPQRVTLQSYMTLPGWSIDWQLGGLSPWLLRTYWGLKERLADLAKLYQAAYENDHLYYTPFQKDADELDRSARTLRAAAKCMEAVVDYCARSLRCDIRAMLAEPWTRAACPALGGSTDASNLSEAERADALRLAWPRRPLAGLLKADPALQASLKLTPGLLQSLDQASKAAQPPDPELPYDLGPPPVQGYYELLAKAPLRRVLENKPGLLGARRTAADESKQVELGCPKDFDKCSSIVYASLVLEPPKAEGALAQFERERKVAQALYRDWVIRARLRPIADAYCGESLRHPMCVDVDIYARDLDVRFGDEAGFLPGSAAPQSRGRRSQTPQISVSVPGLPPVKLPIPAPKLPKLPKL